MLTSIRFLIVLVCSLYTGLVLSQSTDHSDDSFTIHGSINGVRDGMVMLTYPDAMGEKSILDSAAIKNHTFQFKGSIAAPIRAQLYLRGTDHRYASHNLSFYLENSDIKIIINKDTISKSIVTGSHANDDKEAIDSMLKSYSETLNALRTISSFASKQQAEGMRPYIDSLYEKLPEIQRKLIANYALSHPNSFAITSNLFINFTNNQTDLSLLSKIYAHMSPEVKRSPGGREISDLIARMKRVRSGNIAPAFTLPDVNGKPVSLSDFAGKYVLLDFWASWCVPCRAESPYLIEAYNEYKDKNFTIVSISLDVEKDKQKWLDAIKTDGLQWTQVSSLKGYEENGVRQLYSVQGIPDNFLIGPDGRILARGLRGEDLLRQLHQLIK